MLLEQQNEGSLQWAAIDSVAGMMGCTAETIRRLVWQAACDPGLRAGPITEEAEKIRQMAARCANCGG